MKPRTPERGIATNGGSRAAPGNVGAAAQGTVAWVALALAIFPVTAFADAVLAELSQPEIANGHRSERPRSERRTFRPVRGPALWPGAVEVGFSGELVTLAGTPRLRLTLRGGPLLGVRAGHGALLALQGETSWAHVQSLDQWEVQGGAGVGWPVRGRDVWLFAGVGGGVQQEWVGSFSTTRYPLGVDASVRVLLVNAAGVRIDYRYRRMVSDPVADFDRHQVLLGVSLFLHNRPPARRRL